MLFIMHLAHTVSLVVQFVPDISREASAPVGLVGSQGEEWKTARHTLSPSFSAAKMKAVSLSLTINKFI